jgi:hypothetical protein
MSDLLTPFQVPAAAMPAPVIPEPMPIVEKKKAKRELDPFTALKAQKTYSAPIDQNAKSLPPTNGGTADTLGTGGAWGKPS